MKQNSNTSRRWMNKLVMIRFFVILVFGSLIQLSAQTDSMQTISVYGLRSIGIPEILARSLQEQLESSLIQNARYSVLSRNDIEIILTENNFQQAHPCIQKDCIVKVGHLLGVDKIVSGTISKVGATYNLVLKLIDIKTTEIEASANNKYAGSVDSLLSVVELTVGELCKEKPVNLEQPLTQGKEDATDPLFEFDTSVTNPPVYENETDRTSVNKPDTKKPSKKGVNIGIGAVIILTLTMCLLIFK